MSLADLTGKTVLITGASSGIGLEASVTLAKAGGDVVMVARDRTRGEAALAEVKARSGSERVTLMLCDFASQADIRRFAAEFLASHDALHVLVNNAGTVASSYALTEDGLEQTFAVNHLGYFLLTNLLLDLLERSAPARVVSVSSRGNYAGTLDFDDLQFARGGYSIMAAYNRSKLANVLFTVELAARMEGRGVTANCLHPGVVATNIWSGAPWFALPILALMKRIMMITPEQGSDTITWLAASPEAEGQTGGYYDSRKRKRPHKLAQDAEIARKLWEVSAALVKLG